MKRSERIYEYIHRRSKEYAKGDLKGKIGVDAAQIADELDILRNNVSMELNALFRQDRIIKITGRPVKFIDRKSVEAIIGQKLAEGPLQAENIEDCLPKDERSVSPFDNFIGADGSLKKQVEQGKAAILYPPDGLHTLIVGQTGVGKTLFAHLMYEYGRSVGRLKGDAPFVTFNCADYYNNPQLLLAYLFGHIKGAFTGADANKAGLVEAADNGILFLDEIHRLPPEGQEMIFYFMDTGAFKRLGETHRCRRAKVLIIGATTEDPASALLKTFVRRIPNIISIGPLIERSLEEKIDIIKILLADEVQRINKPVKMTVEAVKSLIGSIGIGNVGQLKSNIKLLCAKAFLNCIDNPDYIEIDFKMLPQNIKNGLLTLSANRRELAKLTDIVPESLFVRPSHGISIYSESDKSHDFDLYKVVESKIALLKGEGISNDLIKQIVSTDVNGYIKSVYNKKNTHMTARQRLLKILDEELVNFAEEIVLFVQGRLNRHYHSNFLYAFSLHLSAFLKRVRNNQTLANSEIDGAVEKDSLEFRTAMEIKEKIEDRFDISVPSAEVEYFAILLNSVDEDEGEDKVTILVAAHGKSTASSMVDVAQSLFSGSDMNVIAIDMPIEVSPQATFKKVLGEVKSMNCPKGILVLADMGSLCNIGAMLAEEIKVPVRTLDMVSTPLLLEAMRKADIVGMDLKSLYESLLNFKGYEMEFLENSEPIKNGAIVTICSSGEGAAIKLKELVGDILKQLVDYEIEIVPTGVREMNLVIKKLQRSHEVIAAVGMAKPDADVPYIPLEKLIDGEGENILRGLLKETGRKTAAKDKSMVVHNLCEESLIKFLTYLNPHKIMSVLMDFERVLEQEMGKKLKNPVQIRLLVHVGCALERMVMNGGLTYKEDISLLDTHKLQAVQKAACVFSDKLKISLTDDEIYFISDMI
jgi:transcriptional regulatory protein LevR/transcriptional regulator with AAA-type ATPase domain